jgi:hypothetical protein
MAGCLNRPFSQDAPAVPLADVHDRVAVLALPRRSVLSPVLAGLLYRSRRGRLWLLFVNRPTSFWATTQLFGNALEVLIVVVLSLRRSHATCEVAVARSAIEGGMNYERAERRRDQQDYTAENDGQHVEH